MDHLVLVLGDAQADVLVADPAEQLVGAGPVGVDQQGGEGGHGGRQRLLLGALGLVAAVEGVAQQVRVGAEHALVEVGRDLGDLRTDQRQGGAHGLGVLVGELLVDEVGLVGGGHRSSWACTARNIPGTRRSKSRP